MEALRILAWIYAVILVLALAASLIAIWLYLRKIAAVLGEARSGLSPTVQNTRPLAGHLEKIPEALEPAARDWKEAGSKLERADEHLARLAERYGVTAPTR